jgi:hypothetical protein
VSWVQLVVDGETQFSGVFDDYSNRVPDFVKDIIRPGTRPIPWMKAVAITFTDAILTRQSITMTVWTFDNQGWQLTVEAANESAT